MPLSGKGEFYLRRPYLRNDFLDQNFYGSNGWRTGYAVLQEQWLALFGLAINDPEYISGFSQTLEYEKEHAIIPGGRVLPRWHHDASDAMPNTFTRDGYYECQWGYMLDSQPAYAIDVAEQFDMTGNMIWLKSFKQSCESALEYMIRRDSDGNGLYEVIQNSHLEEKGTDWLDVVWASYEVASINALMYKALIRWSELEILLDDQKMAERYLSLELIVNNASEIRWKQTSGSEKTRVEYILKGLKPAKRYTLLVNNTPVKVAQPDKKGNLNFGCSGDKKMITVKVE